MTTYTTSTTQSTTIQQPLISTTNTHEQLVQPTPLLLTSPLLHNTRRQCAQPLKIGGAGGGGGGGGTLPRPTLPVDTPG